MTDKESLFHQGVKLAEAWCALNQIPMPAIDRLNPKERNYHIGTCAYYRPTTIHIMVEKCAANGMGGRAWSWPGYKIDRTPYGVIQHELGHHVDTVRTPGLYRKQIALTDLFSHRLYQLTDNEPPLTGYLGTDTNHATFYMEWFAENLRLFVTNPDLSLKLRPRFFNAAFNAGLRPVHNETWEEILLAHGATERIVEQARKQIANQETRNPGKEICGNLC